MVTTTETNDDDMPTHDAHGTDLRRVRAMMAAGYTDSMIAECLAISWSQMQYARQVVTGDRDGCPAPEEIREACRRIQDGWTEEQAIAARRGLARTSSVVVNPDRDAKKARACDAVRQHWARVRAERIASGKINVVFHPEFRETARRWQVRVNALGRNASRFFHTRDEADAWGREWLRQRHEAAGNAACSGR